MLACEAAAYYAAQGMSLLDTVNALYAEFGWYRNALHSFTFEGETGMHTMQGIMAGCGPKPPPTSRAMPLPASPTTPPTAPGLPKADVLEYRLANGAKVMVRPSGTEPKVKVYLSAVADSAEAADAINEKLAQAAAAWMH